MTGHDVVCPFHTAGANSANAQRAGSPASSKAGQRNSLSLLYKHAQFHVGMDNKGARTTMLIGILERSPLNKHPQNSGLMSRAVPDASGGAYVAESTLRAFYGDHLFPTV